MPPPEMVERYEAVHPGAAKIIFDEFQKQSTHRQSLERTVVEGNTVVQRRGNWQAFIIALVGLGVCAVAFVNGQPAAGVAVFLAELMGLAGIFVYSKERDQRERNRNE